MSKDARRPVRGRARLAVAATLPVAVLAVLLTGSPAHASPEGWPQADPVPLTSFVLVLVILPLAVAAVVAFLALAPSLARGDRDDAGVATDQWFGGPRLEGKDGPAELPAPASGEDTGGASGRW